MKFIRRVNLDMLWSRERGTVTNLMTNYRKSVAADEELGLPSLFPQQGPWEVDDNQGFRWHFVLLLYLEQLVLAVRNTNSLIPSGS